MKYQIRKPFLKSLWAVGVITIVALSVLPSDQIPDVGDISDKIKHFAAYAGVGFLGMIAASSNKHRIWLVIAMIAFGLVMEGVQYFLPTRQFELLDGVANTLGVLSALGAYYVYNRLRK